ncbi:hypothetical protein ASPFODRAFT_709522 [Aspergillus luchuensis CBS 106.47]|uniref:Uncharacterized protein n=1 Tax=Aspergillus luchuensis (strain CBS 106.47) TaxID=1137211 RepID=A0A1M3TQQ8_ASPLC|nr:hypothetical protein ASPFODRAFT_709522 [Aspergillus luchuensis CBS 106.47]
MKPFMVMSPKTCPACTCIPGQGRGMAGPVNPRRHRIRILGHWKVQCGHYPFPMGRQIRSDALQTVMLTSATARREAWKVPDERQHAAEHMPTRNLGGKHVDPGWQGPSYGRFSHVRVSAGGLLYTNASSSILA